MFKHVNLSEIRMCKNVKESIKKVLPETDKIIKVKAPYLTGYVIKDKNNESLGTWISENEKSVITIF